MTLTAGTKRGPYEIEAPWRRRALTARVMDGTESGLRAARLQNLERRVLTAPDHC
jgi:hypothetical protein